MKLEENRAPDPKEESMAGDRQEIMEIAMRAGHILLENGAEISRVEETIDRICRHYGIQSANSFVLSNGIFSTMGNQREEFFARVQHIPVSGAHLNRVAAVNQLSREIEEGKHTIADLERCLDDIENMPGKRNIVQIMASAVGSGAFCLFFGGDLLDSAAAFLSGMLLYVYILYGGYRLSRLVEHILGGALVTFLCMVFYHLGLGHNVSSMIIGSVIPMIPGVALHQRDPGSDGRGLYCRFGADDGYGAGGPGDRPGSGDDVHRLLPDHRRESAMTELSAWFAFFPSFPTGELFKQLLAAGVGTAAFSVLFYVPRKYYGFCAACGAWGWLTYFVLEWAGMTVTEATFFAAAAVVFLSRLFAVMERCPATLFMIPGIFPLVPGAGIYWTAYYIVTDQMELASRTGFSAVKAAVAIVLGIIFVFEIPQSFFKRVLGKKRAGETARNQ